MNRTERILRELRRKNPGLVVKDPGSGSHYKLFMNGHLAGIIPASLAKEGLSYNLKAQLRRGGITV